MRDTDYKVCGINDRLQFTRFGLGSRALAALASTSSFCPSPEHLMYIIIYAHFLRLIFPFPQISVPDAKKFK